MSTKWLMPLIGSLVTELGYSTVCRTEEVSKTAKEHGTVRLSVQCPEIRGTPALFSIIRKTLL